MKILALLTDAFGGYGGIAQYNRDLLTALSSASDVSEILALVRLAPDPVHKLPSKVRQFGPVPGRLAYSLEALRLALANRPDIVLSGHLFHGPLGAGVASALGVPLVSQLHGTEIWPRPRHRDAAALKASKLVLCVSQDTANRLSAHLPEQSPATRVLPNTVRPQFVPGDRAKARARFGTEGQTALLSVSRLDDRGGYKGHDLVIEQVGHFMRGGRAVHYLIAGDGPDRARLEAMAIRYGVAQTVRFLGRVPDEDLPDLYRAVDLFVLPSTGEGFGIVYLEAMGCGTLALGLDVGGAPDALCHGELGISVAREQFPNALARALDAERPDPIKLSEAVHRRFGYRSFSAKVHDMVGSLN